MFQLSDCNRDAPAATTTTKGERRIQPLPLFLPCLAGSIALHLLIAFLLLQPLSSARNMPRIQYVDLRSISLPEPATVQAPQQTAVPLQNRPPENITAQQNATESNNTASPQQPQPDNTSAPSLGLGLAKGYFRSLAEGKSLRDDIRNYYFEMVEKINASWWQRADSLRESARQEGVVDIVLGRDGTLYSTSLLISTGTSEVDQAIMEVVRAASPFAPLPASYPGEQFQAPLRIVAPASLFRLKR